MRRKENMEIEIRIFGTKEIFEDIQDSMDAVESFEDFKEKAKGNIYLDNVGSDSNPDWVIYTFNGAAIPCPYNVEDSDGKNSGEVANYLMELEEEMENDPEVWEALYEDFINRKTK